MIDSHAHLFSDEIRNRLEEHLTEFKTVGGKHILNVSIDSFSIGEVIQQSIQYENKFPDLILAGLGVHPESVTHTNSQNLKQLETLKEAVSSHRKRVVAIGECGLDYYHLANRSELSQMDKEEIKDYQKNIFKEQVLLSIQENLPLSIHTRDITGESSSIMDALKIITTVGKGSARGVFHSYTGDISVVDEILSLGFYIGFNGIVTYPKADNVREILKATPLNRILLETDCPYLPPQLARNGKRTSAKYGKPHDIEEIAETVEQIKEKSVSEIIEITDNNFKELFLSN